MRLQKMEVTGSNPYYTSV